MKALIKTGIILALIFMIAELTYINAKSLVFITKAANNTDFIFSIIGSLAFSMVTVFVMINEASKGFMKVFFPLFDAILVFCGLNLKYADLIIQGTDNPIRLLLTVFMALFAGLITYSLGSITFIDLIDKENEQESDYKLKWNEAGKKLDSLRSELNSVKNDNNTLKSKINSDKTEIDLLKTDLLKYKSESEKYKSVYLNSEKSRILKKKAENRTDEEKELLKISA